MFEIWFNPCHWGFMMSVFCFSVRCDVHPSSLPRVLEVFALHGHTPDQCHSTAAASELTVDVQMSGLDEVAAGLLAKRLGRVVTVSSVLYSEKTRAAA